MAAEVAVAARSVPVGAVPGVAALRRTPAEAGHRLEDGGAAIAATLAAGCADKPRLNVGQPEAIRPLIPADRKGVATAIVRTIDQQPTDTLGTHVCEPAS